MRKEKVFEYVELDDKTPIQKLSILDQVRILFRKLTYDASQELKRDDAVTREELKLKADLIDFILKATEPIRNGEHRKVLISISNKFDPILESVLRSKRISNYYGITIDRPNIEYDIPFFIRVTLEVKK